MPVYEYQCKACGQEFEYQQRMSDPEKTTCEACGGSLDRLISRTAFQLKGSGWYKDLYSSQKPASGKAESGTEASGSSDKAASTDKSAASANASGGSTSGGSTSGGSTSGGSTSGGSTSGGSSTGGSGPASKAS
jgi:putative FmdB family regulatory protein